MFRDMPKSHNFSTVSESRVVRLSSTLMSPKFTPMECPPPRPAHGMFPTPHLPAHGMSPAPWPAHGMSERPRERVKVERCRLGTTERGRGVEKSEEVEKIEKVEKSEEVERIEKVEEVEKIEKMEGSVEGEEVERIEKVERIEEVEKIEKMKMGYRERGGCEAREG